MYHTVTISSIEVDGETAKWDVLAQNNEGTLLETVGSVAINGVGAGVLVDGSCELQAARDALDVEIVDFTDEYGYTEAQITFEER